MRNVLGEPIFTRWILPLLMMVAIQACVDPDGNSVDINSVLNPPQQPGVIHVQTTLSVNPSIASVYANSSFSFEATGGSTPYQWSIVSGSGLITNAGVFQSNTSGLTRIQVRDANNDTVQVDVSVLALGTLANDPNFGNLWGLHNIGQVVGGSAGTVDVDVDAPEAWEVTSGDCKGVLVAVVDSGIDYNHPDLSPNIWRNLAEIPNNGIDEDLNGFIDDFHGYDFVNNDSDPVDEYFHGTHVAGIIGARGNNSVGVSGVCWYAKIMALKFFQDATIGGPVSALLSSLQYARDNGAKVVNNSWGITGIDAATISALQSALGGDPSILQVVSAGNGVAGVGVNLDTTAVYPSELNLANMISVAATNKNDVIAGFSNFGVQKVHLAAPGVQIYSTMPTTQTNFGFQQGTSMSAPHVTAAAAMYWTQNPNATLAQVKNAILSGVDPVPGLATKVQTGGRLNIDQMLGF